MYLADMIKQRREAETKGERYDLFSSLLDASKAEGDTSLKLTDSELMGRCCGDMNILPLLTRYQGISSSSWWPVRPIPFATSV